MSQQDPIPPLFRPASENLFRPAGNPGEGLQFQNIVQQDSSSSGSNMAEELSNGFEGPSFLTSTNVVFQCYAFYAALLVLKMIILAFMTVGTRVKKKSKVSSINIIEVEPKTSRLTQATNEVGEPNQDHSKQDMKDKQTSNPEQNHSHITEDGKMSLAEDGKGSLAQHIGASVSKGLQIAALDIKDKGVSFIKTNIPKSLPTDLKTLPSHVKSNVKHIGASSFKYVRKQITLKKLAIFAFELMTAKVYSKIGMAVVYGLFNLAWNAYMKTPNKNEMESRTLDQSRTTASEVFVTPEDINMNGGVVTFDDPDIERIRRAHLNDLENIPSFLIICLVYIMTDPGTMLASWLIRIFTLARFLHTFVYTIYVLPQPSRAICYLTGTFIQVYMAIVVILNFAHAY